MHLTTLTEGQKELTSPVYYKQQQKLKVQHTKILNALREQKIEEKLIVIIAQFLKLEDERKGKILCVRMSAYLDTLTFELTQFIAEEHQEPAPKLFRLFLRMNFNKEAIYRYYRDRLDQLLAEPKVDTKAVLNQFSHKCSSPVRGDVAYNLHGNQLKADMLSEVENRLLRFRQDNEDFKPIHFGVSTGIMGAIIYASLKASLIEQPSIKSRFYKTLRRVLRRPDGTPYEESTFKNAITDVQEKHIEGAKEVLIKMGQALDKRSEDLKK